MASKTHEILSMDKLIKWLHNNMPESHSNHVVHGDFRLVYALSKDMCPIVACKVFLYISLAIRDLSNLPKVEADSFAGMAVEELHFG